MNQYGNLIEVINVDLNYCESNLYFNINFQLDGNPFDEEFIVVFNGNTNHQVLMRHKYEIHPNMNFNLGQYYVDENLCPNEPTNEELSNSVIGC
jgi:hypothetical protein